MYVNLEGLNNSEMEFFKAKQYVENALTYLNTIKMPDKFLYEQEMKKVTKEVNNLNAKVEKIRKILAGKREEYTIVEKKNVTLIEDLISKMSAKNIGLDTNTSSTGVENAGLTNSVSNTNIQGNTSSSGGEKVGLTSGVLNTNIQESVNGNAAENITNTETTFDINIQNTTGGYTQQNVGVSNTMVAQGINNVLQFNNGQGEGYTELQNSLTDLYKMKDVNETNKILSLMSNNNQINDYAIGTEKVVNSFGNRTKEFKEQFGFDFYREGEYGESIPNVELIYANIFLNINSDLISKDADGNNIVNPTLTQVDQTQGINLKSDYSIKSNETGAIDTYLSSKGV